MFIIIYVDDLIIGGDSLVETLHVKMLLEHEFDMKDLGDLDYFLGVEINCTSHGIPTCPRNIAASAGFSSG